MRRSQNMDGPGTSGDWFTKPEFNRYWELQRRVEEWQQRHYATLQRFRRSQAFTFPPPIPPPPPPPWISKQPEYDEDLSSMRMRWNLSADEQLPGSSHPGSRVIKSQTTETFQGDYQEDEGDEYETEEEYEEETLIPEAEKQLDEKMVAFFRQTVLHRMEREKEKDDLKARGLWFMPTTEDFVDPDTALSRSETSIRPPNVQQSREKAERARDEYGEKGDAILAKEVLLRMKFDDEMRASKPNFWPNLPLNL